MKTPIPVQRYIFRIKNTSKRVYAQRYWSYLAGETTEAEPVGISYMAAQAVRMFLTAEHLKANSETGISTPLHDA